MNGFLTFLSQKTSGPSNGPEAFDVFGRNVEKLIEKWLEKYIVNYNPGYTVPEAMMAVRSGTYSVSDDEIRFSFQNPYSHIREEFAFTKEILPTILATNKDTINRILSQREIDIETKIFAITPELLGIIHSWLPDILPRKIVGVNIIPFDDGADDFEYYAQHDHLEVYYLSEHCEIKSRRLPNVFQ